MISSRFALPVILCFSLVLVPTVIHNYIGLLDDDGKSAMAIPQKLDSYTSEPTRRKAQWVRKTFNAEDWIERVYMDPDGSQVRLFVARSYDHKRLYHHPELALSYGQPFGPPQMFTLSEKRTIPVFVLTKDRVEWVAYAMQYDGNFVDHPIRHQFFNLISNLVSGRRKLTLFYVSGTASSKNEAFEQSKAKTVLLLAIESFQTQKPEKTPGSG